MQITINKDRKLETHPSEWVDGPDGGKFLIYAIDKPNFQHFQNEHLAAERFEKQVKSYVSDEEVVQSNREFAGIIGKYLIAGWQDIGVDLPFSHENAQNLLMYGETKDNPDYGLDLGLWVFKQAKQIRDRAILVKAQALGKSSNSTSGKKDSQDSQSTKKSKGKRLA